MRLLVGADSTAGVEALAAAMKGATTSPRILIEIDSGGARTGVRPELAGVHRRHAATVGSRWSARSPTRATATGGRSSARRPAEDAVSSLEVAAASLRAEGIEPLVLSAGATPTFELSAHGIVTEERPGTYVFGDRQQAALRVNRPRTWR